MAGLAAAFGSGSMTNSFRELEDADCILVFGSNTTVAHPVASRHLLRAREKGKRLVVIDPRRTHIDEQADMHLPIKPGTDVALVNSLLHVIYKNGWQNQEFIDQRTENSRELLQAIENYPPEKAAKICEIPAEDIEKIAKWYSSVEKGSIVYVLGITQHSHGVDNVKSLANLAMFCGHIGRPSTGVNPFRGQNNVQGACDMGVLPNVLTGYQKVFDENVREKFERAWDAKLSDQPGLTQVEQIEALIDGRMKGLVVFGANPLMSYPDVDRVRKAYEAAEFVLSIDIFPTPSTDMSDVVLPGASFAETDGTFTSSERRVQRLHKAIEPLGGKTNWQIIQELAQRLGSSMHYEAAEAIFKEIAELTPYYQGMSYPRIEARGLCWPCPDSNHPGTQYLHKDKFTHGKGIFHPVEYKGAAEVPDEEYPFWLITGTIYNHYLTGSMTGRCISLNKEGSEAIVEINPNDAEKLGVSNEDILRAKTRRGNIEVRAVITDKLTPGSVFIPLHFIDQPANRLTSAALDPVSKTPEYKACAVKLEAV